jgi:hypothetical protein
MVVAATLERVDGSVTNDLIPMTLALKLLFGTMRYNRH